MFSRLLKCNRLIVLLPVLTMSALVAGCNSDDDDDGSITSGSVNSGLTASYDLLYCHYNDTTSVAAYTHGDRYPVVVGGDTLEFTSEGLSLSGAMESESGTEIIWSDTDHGYEYALSNNETGVFNEINLSQISGAFLGQFSEDAQCPDGAGGGTGGSGSGETADPNPSVNRNISFGPNAASPYPVASPDDAARVAASFAGALAAADSGSGSTGGDQTTAQSETTHTTANATVNTACADGGSQQTETQGTTTITTTVTFDQCHNDSMWTDGVIETQCEINFSTFESNCSDIEFGSGSEPIVFQFLAPADEARSVLLLGAIEVEGEQVSPVDVTYTYPDLSGAIEVIDGSERVSFALKNYTLDVVEQDDGDFEQTHSGTYQVSGSCGSGSGVIATNTPIVTDAQSGQTKAGEITYQGSETVTVTYNSNGTVTVVSPSGSNTYTQEELKAKCNL